MNYDVVVPELGESINEGILVQWLKKNDEYIEQGEELFELETDKATLSVPSPASGIVNILVEEGMDVTVGQVVARIIEGQKPDQRKDLSQQSEKSTDKIKEKQSQTAFHLYPAAQRKYSPAVRRLVAEHDLDPEEIVGTGKDGRLTKADVIVHIDEKKKAERNLAKSGGIVPKEKRERTPSDHHEITPPDKDSGKRQTRVPVPTIRRRIAERLVQAQNQSAFLTTFNEINMSQVIDLRKQYQQQFTEKYGVKLGFMSFFVKACCDSLKEFPQVNAFLEESDIVFNNYYDIGIAVSTERGLVVPIIKNADSLSYAEVETAIADFAQRARSKKLTLDELIGGTFSISNGGVFGSLLSTPIPNPPQTAILGLHTIQQRPVAIGNDIIIQPMMYVALSYDHRLIDGREAVSFLKSIKEKIENPERVMLHI